MEQLNAAGELTERTSSTQRGFESVWNCYQCMQAAASQNPTEAPFCLQGKSEKERGRLLFVGGFLFGFTACGFYQVGGDTVEITLTVLRDPTSTPRVLQNQTPHPTSASLLLSLSRKGWEGTNLFQHSDLLKTLKNLPLDGPRGIDVSGRTVPAVLGSSVELGERSDSDVFAEVDVAGDGGCGEHRRAREEHWRASERGARKGGGEKSASVWSQKTTKDKTIERTGANVVPIRIVRRKLVTGARLDDIDPCRNLDLSCERAK